jgi:hypothetical protein
MQKIFGIGEGLKYRPFCAFVDLCPRPPEGPVLRSFSYVKQSWGFFSPFRNSDRLAGTFHHRRSRFLKTGFLHAGEGAENTKEKSRQCFTSWSRTQTIGILLDSARIQTLKTGRYLRVLVWY